MRRVVSSFLGEDRSLPTRQFRCPSYHPDDAAQRNAAAAEFRRYDAPGVYKYRIRLDNFSCGWVVESAGTDIKPPVPMPPPKASARVLIARVFNMLKS